MPTALIIQLRPNAAAWVARSLGRAIHANLLRTIDAADAELAARLHDDKGVKPLTASNILELRGRDSHISITPEQSYSVRVTLLSPELEELASSWTPATLGSWDLDGSLWTVEAVICDATQHPWSGRVSYGELANQTEPQRAPARWNMEFASPVTFRQRHINQPLPLPVLVFGSLLDKWNSFAPLAFPDELRRFAEECIAVSRLNLRSVAEPTKNNALQIGSVGRCTYTAINRDRYWCTCIDTLARYAFWSGIGAGATRGFGRARLLSQSSRED